MGGAGNVSVTFQVTVGSNISKHGENVGETWEKHGINSMGYTG